MIKKKAKVYLHGQMVENTMGIGRMESKMAKVSTRFQAVNLKEEGGLMAKESLGSEYNSFALFKIFMR